MASSSMLDCVLSALSNDNREVLGQIYSDYLPQHLKAQRNIAHVALRYIVCMILRILKRFIKYSYMQARAIDIMDGVHLIKEPRHYYEK